MSPHRAPLPPGLLLLLLAAPLPGADFHDSNADRDALPAVPPGFTLSVFARDPLVRQPCAMAFDARGRLHVGMGPQYRNPKPDTPGDQVVLVLDENGDGQADRTRVFARGFNAIQGLAWRGRDLWVANAPDLTVVRDRDGDDMADEYVRVYTDLGNLEHGLHGLNWAPDGKLYMSKGNSKGLSQPGRMAPRPFRELWGVTAPPDAPDFPAPRTFTAANYEKAYHDPEDDWGREGGILRCDDGGRNLEIVARGFRNPWDIAFDSGFHWLGTDNDQTTGDRVFMSFPGAHFGWNHPWSSHWSDQPHAPTAPVSGPLWEGSGTGVVFSDSPAFPATHRGVFLINDWLGKTTYAWRPRWDGALLRPDGAWEPFVRGGRALYRPTDLAFGPDGALYILGWGSGYGAEYRAGQWVSEGRIFRVAAAGAEGGAARVPRRDPPLAARPVAALLAEFDAPLPVWRTDAQEELVSRGAAVRADLEAALAGPVPSEGRETWTAWTLGRLLPADRTVDDGFAARAGNPATRLNLRLQSLRILAHRAREARDGRALPAVVTAALRDPEPRVRFEAVQALQRVRQEAATPALLDLAARETDPATFYAAWQTLRVLASPAARRSWLADPRAGVRRAALLALLEDHALPAAEVRPFAQDTNEQVRAMADLWLRKAAAGGENAQVRGRPLQATPPPAAAPAVPGPVARAARTRNGGSYPVIAAGLRAGARPYHDRSYVLKNVPGPLEGLDFIQSANQDDASRGPRWLSFEALLPVRVHVGLDARAPVPSWLRQDWREEDQTVIADHWKFRVFSREFPAGSIALGGNTDDGKSGGKGSYLVALAPLPLTPPAAPAGLDEALAQLPRGDRDRGAWLFHRSGGAGCFQCHRLEGHGNAFGPDLAGLGDRATARHILESLLDPNAVITEGYRIHEVATAEAELAGILLEESGLSLTLGLANGERLVVPKARITARRSGAASAMPAYNSLLTPGHAADLAAYLLAQKASAPPAPATVGRTGPPAPPSWPAGEGFQVRATDDRLVLAHAGKPVGEFVFQDARILRPYFANLHTPDGVPVTRTHPPVPGVDATDHETMHPGLWLAFGSLSGVDFWRNRGRIEHVRFAVPPSAPGPGRPLVFAAESRLRAPDGRLLGWMTNRLELRTRPGAWEIEWDATLWSGTEDLVFGDQEEMGLGARVATALTEKNGGRITSSTGRTGAAQTWGQPAAWCDYSGAVQGRPAGITLIPHRDNFRPCWWHNRDYGVFVANPFGRAALQQGEPSRVTARRGEPFRLRFTALLHGPLPELTPHSLTR